MLITGDDGIPTSSRGTGAVYKDNCVASAFADLRPLIAPEDVRNGHLWGIPLYSAIPDPVTKRRQKMENEDIKSFIHRAVGIAELECNADFFQRRYSERQPYDAPAQQSYGYMVTRHRPGYSVESLSIASSDGQSVLDIPLAWVETGYIHMGQINLMPFAVTSNSGTVIPTGSPMGTGLMPQLFRYNWVPSLWKIEYTTGFPDGKLPGVVNELIGVVAAMEILSMLASTYAQVNSASLGIDGLSQSQSLPGAQIFVPRLTDLAAKRKWMVKRLKAQWGLLIMADNV